MIMDYEELKKLFDAVLSDKLKLLAKEYGFRSGKLALKKKNSDKNIELSLIYSKKGLGYYISSTAFDNELNTFLTESKIPYKSNNLADTYQLFFSTLSEKKPLYPISNQGNLIKIPQLSQIEEITDATIKLLQQEYIPLLVNFSEMNEGLIRDIISKPSLFNYPLPTLVFCCIKNNIRKLEKDFVLNKNIIKNQEFDLKMLNLAGISLE